MLLPAPLPDAGTYFLIHDAEGRVLRSGLCPYAGLEGMLLDPEQETLMITAELVPSDGSVWVVDGLLEPGLEMTPAISATSIAADGVDECVITSLPDPCTVWISGAVNLPPTEVAGGEITLTSTQIGEITIRISAHRHRRLEVTIHAL